MVERSKARVCDRPLAGIAEFESRRGHGCLCCVCCTVRTKSKKPGQSVQRSMDKVQKKSRWGHGCLSLVSVVCYQVKVSATGRSLVQRSPTNCSGSLCVIYKPRALGGHGPRWAVAPETFSITTVIK